ncbi:hypothetical protein [Pirellulimonas nuda]|nr:hypothetical protein [Pirellulimonas nuda]
MTPLSPHRRVKQRSAGRVPGFERCEDRLALDGTAAAFQPADAWLSLDLSAAPPVVVVNASEIRDDGFVRLSWDSTFVQGFGDRGFSGSVAVDGSTEYDIGDTLLPPESLGTAMSPDPPSASDTGIERIPVPPWSIPVVGVEAPRIDSGLVDLNFAASPTALRLETQAEGVRQSAQLAAAGLPTEAPAGLEPDGPTRETIAPRAAIFEVAAADPSFGGLRGVRPPKPSEETSAATPNLDPQPAPTPANIETVAATASPAASPLLASLAESLSDPYDDAASVDPAAADAALAELAADASSSGAEPADTPQAAPLVGSDSRRTEAISLAMAALLVVGRHAGRKRPRTERRRETPALEWPGGCGRPQGSDSA